MGNLPLCGETDVSVKQKILLMLNSVPEGYVSGEKISQALGITRSAVWKHMEQLREDGYVIDSVSRKGYKLISGPDVLYPGEILKGLETRIFGKEMMHYHSVDSTNNRAKEAAEKGAPEGTVILAEQQTGGRGRMDRPWKSPAGGIWMSFVLRPEIPPHLASGLTMMAAVAVVQAVRKVTGLEPLIKWPNDIYLQGRKICGILTEMKAEMDMVNYVVTGIGLNANIDLAVLGKDAPHAGSLSGFLSRNVDRKELVREMLVRLEENYLVFSRKGIAPILERWRENNFTLGRCVVLKQGDREFAGLAEDVSPEGGLILRDEKGDRKVFYSGEVTVTGHEHI